MHSHEIILCRPEDLETLQQVSIETFDDAFRNQNLPEVIDAYMEVAFSEAKLSAELQNPESRFWFLKVDGETAGYLKLNTGSAQSDFQGDDAMELERIYIRKGFQGKGFGAVLVRHAFGCAKKAGKQRIWLGVWQRNERAVVFYRAHGFREVGTHDFRMGEELQTDWVMERKLD